MPPAFKCVSVGAMMPPWPGAWWTKLPGATWFAHCVAVWPGLAVVAPLDPTLDVLCAPVVIDGPMTPVGEQSRGDATPGGFGFASASDDAASKMIARVTVRIMTILLVIGPRAHTLAQGASRR